MPKRVVDYESFHVSSDGDVWLLKEDAIRLGAGYLPVHDDKTMTTKLWAPNEQAELNLLTLLGAINDDRLTIERPLTLDRDGFRYVEATGFLNWLGQYITQTLAKEIPFPKKEFALAVENARIKASLHRPPANEAFESLTLALEGQFDKPLTDLPAALRQRIERDLITHSIWDRGSPEQRQAKAAQWDYWHDPATEPERRAKRKRLTQLDEELGEAEKDLAEWEATGARFPSEKESKDSNIKKLKERIARLKEDMEDTAPATSHQSADPQALAPPVTTPALGRQDADQQPALRRGDKLYRGQEKITDAYNRIAGTKLKWAAIRLRGKEQGLNIVHEKPGNKKIPTLDHYDLLDFLDLLPR